ncbi:hypothetical protein JAAARDRAFT_188467 [Jaapia argillacea MUCL 33604]|uniref:Uncharacterized protein n=1 Tax=Jaapia argillacea MUCL 33604 TaxID=933084 RepID=A0A067QE32_9AGAM|nr:hypothetical protein JAAARDRAFT_188467 [Jaapia argillacea MUCL 33604]
MATPELSYSSLVELCDTLMRDWNDLKGSSPTFGMVDNWFNRSCELVRHSAAARCLSPLNMRSRAVSFSARSPSSNPGSMLLALSHAIPSSAVAPTPRSSSSATGQPAAFSTSTVSNSPAASFSALPFSNQPAGPFSTSPLLGPGSSAFLHSSHATPTSVPASTPTSLSLVTPAINPIPGPDVDVVKVKREPDLLEDKWSGPCKCCMENNHVCMNGPGWPCVQCSTDRKACYHPSLDGWASYNRDEPPNLQDDGLEELGEPLEPRPKRGGGRGGSRGRPRGTGKRMRVDDNDSHVKPPPKDTKKKGKEKEKAPEVSQPMTQSSVAMANASSSSTYLPPGQEHTVALIAMPICPYSPLTLETFNDGIATLHHIDAIVSSVMSLVAVYTSELQNLKLLFLYRDVMGEETVGEDDGAEDNHD